MANDDTPVSPVTTKAPEFIITRASVNHEPVELDGTPLTSMEQRLARKDSSADQPAGQNQERRQQRISERKHDPAVLVDIPQTPRADELATSGAHASPIKDENK